MDVNWTQKVIIEGKVVALIPRTNKIGDRQSCTLLTLDFRRANAFSEFTEEGWVRTGVKLH